MVPLDQRDLVISSCKDKDNGMAKKECDKKSPYSSHFVRKERKKERKPLPYACSTLSSSSWSSSSYILSSLSTKYTKRTRNTLSLKSNIVLPQVPFLFILSFPYSNSTPKIYNYLSHSMTTFLFSFLKLE